MHVNDKRIKTYDAALRMLYANYCGERVSSGKEPCSFEHWFVKKFPRFVREWVERKYPDGIFYTDPFTDREE